MNSDTKQFSFEELMNMPDDLTNLPEEQRVAEIFKGLSNDQMILFLEQRCLDQNGVISDTTIATYLGIHMIIEAGEKNDPNYSEKLWGLTQLLMRPCIRRHIYIIRGEARVLLNKEEKTVENIVVMEDIRNIPRAFDRDLNYLGTVIENPEKESRRFNLDEVFEIITTWPQFSNLNRILPRLKQLRVFVGGGDGSSEKDAISINGLKHGDSSTEMAQAQSMIVVLIQQAIFQILGLPSQYSMSNNQIDKCSHMHCVVFNMPDGSQRKLYFQINTPAIN